MTTRELTPEEMAELTERLKAGDLSAIKAAVSTAKPKRAPKAPQPKPPPDPLSHLRRQLSELSTLHAKLMEGRRYIDSLRKLEDRRAQYTDEGARKFWAEEPSMTVALHAELETFLQTLRLHFNPLETP